MYMKLLGMAGPGEWRNAVAWQLRVLPSFLGSIRSRQKVRARWLSPKGR